MEKYIAFDCETGGLDSQVNSLLTVYFIVFDRNFKVLGELDLKIKPDKGQNYVLTGEAMGINKIDIAEHDKIAITLSQAKSDLYNFLQAHNPDGKTKLIPVGHNVYFDEEFVCAHLISKGNWHKFCSYRRLDTGVALQFMKLTKMIPVDVSGSLQSIVEFFNIPKSGDYHDAKVDTVLTVKVLRAMIKAATKD
jgi:DNA polymerase III alpha subunit (gram-positive type)